MTTNDEARASLEMLAALLPAGEAKEVVENLIVNPYPAAQTALMLATHLGSHDTWDGGADWLEFIANDLAYYGPKFPHPGGPDTMELYRQIADMAGIEYYKEEDDNVT